MNFSSFVNPVQQRLAAFYNNPGNRNVSQRRRAMLKVANLPIPRPDPMAAARAQIAAQTNLPKNQNNLIKAQRKAAREQPNIWNMNQGRSLFQLGLNVTPKPVQSTPVQSSPFEPSGDPSGLAKSQLRKAEKAVAQLKNLEKGRVQNNGLGNNPLMAINSSLLERNKVRNLRRIENNTKRKLRATKENQNAFVSPVGLFGNNAFIENLKSNQNKMAQPMFSGTVNNTQEGRNAAYEAAKARVAAAENVERRAAAAYTNSAVKAPWVGQPAPNSPEVISTPTNNAYNKAKRTANSRKNCTPCEEVILEKLDTLLDRSKPTNILGSAKRTVQSGLEATLLGLKEAGAAGKAGLGVAGVAVLVGAIRVGQAAAAGARKVGGAAADTVVAAATALETAARKARNCIKGSPIGANRSVRCAAAYAEVQQSADKLKSLIPSLPPMPWPPAITFPKFNYFTLRNANGKSQFNRNVNRARGVLGRFGTRVSTGLGAFGSRVRNVTGRAARAVRNTAGRGATAVRGAMYRLSGREQADMIKELLERVKRVEAQGGNTNKAVTELKAAMAAAQPGVVTAQVKAEAAQLGPEFTNVALNGNIGAGTVNPASYGILGGKRSRKNRKNRKASRKASRKN